MTMTVHDPLPGLPDDMLQDLRDELFVLHGSLTGLWMYRRGISPDLSPDVRATLHSHMRLAANRLLDAIGLPCSLPILDPYAKGAR